MVFLQSYGVSTARATRIYKTYGEDAIQIVSENPYRLAGNILHTVHTARHPTLQHRNSYNRTDNHRQWNAVGSPDDGHKDARNMLR